MSSTTESGFGGLCLGIPDRVGIGEHKHQNTDEVIVVQESGHLPVCAPVPEQLACFDARDLLRRATAQSGR